MDTYVYSVCTDVAKASVHMVYSNGIVSFTFFFIHFKVSALFFSRIYVFLPHSLCMCGVHLYLFDCLVKLCELVRSVYLVSIVTHFFTIISNPMISNYINIYVCIMCTHVYFSIKTIVSQTIYTPSLSFSLSTFLSNDTSMYRRKL